MFGDMEGYVGMFEGVYPSNKTSGGGAVSNDTLADDSLLMEVGAGICLKMNSTRSLVCVISLE